MPANLENSAVATGLEKVNFHSNPKERQCQRMFKLLHNCTHFTFQQGNVQNPSSQASTVCEPKTSRCKVGFRKGRGTRDQIVNIHGSQKKEENSRKTSTSALLTRLKLLIMWITTDCEIYKEMGKTDHLTCLLRNLYAGQEVKLRTRRGTKDWFKIGKGIRQDCILSPVYSTYMQSTL